MKALFDTNIIVDVLQRREPWFADCSRLFLLAAANEFEGFITSKEAADIWYFSRRQFRGQDDTDMKARNVLVKLFALFGIIDTLAADCQNALASADGDYEDAIMAASASRSGMDCIITRNAGHYKSSAVPVYTPQEFLEQWPGLKGEPAREG